AEVYYLFDVQPYRIRQYLPSVAATAVSAGSVYASLHLLFDPVPPLILIPAFLLFAGLYGVLFVAFGGLSDRDIEVLRAVDEKTDADLGPVKKVFRRLHR
ncbi:MAG: hypothetical protein ABEK12_01055, partial [Candidatus Nanohaloarchaea archaeon]